jgi:hypothetical protein
MNQIKHVKKIQRISQLAILYNLNQYVYN